MPARPAQHYQEAVRFLKEAAEAIDQAHSEMKDATLDDIEIRTAHGPMRIRLLSQHVSDMLREMQKAGCPWCDHRISLHADKYGCEYERGDVPMRSKDGDDVTTAAGSCGCQWGKSHG
jgi:hypothetical protein